MIECRVHLLRDCVINPPPAAPGSTFAMALGPALLGVAVPRLIGAALTGVATALKRAGSEETVQVAGHVFDNLYEADDRQALRPNANFGCVLAVWYDTRYDTTGTPDDDAVSTKLKTERLVPREAVVKGAFEATLRPTDDGTAFFLDTRHFSVRSFLGDRKKDERAFVVTVGIASPAPDRDGRTVALGVIDLHTVRRGASVVPMGAPLDGEARYRSNLMPWAPLSAPSRAAYDRDLAAGVAAGRRYMPVTVSVTVSETADGNRFLLTLGELLGGMADDAAKVIARQILPSDSDTADAAANAEKLYDEELKAQVDEAKAKSAWIDAIGDEKAPLRLAWELAARRLAWRRRLREAAGLPARPPLDPSLS